MKNKGFKNFAIILLVFILVLGSIGAFVNIMDNKKANKNFFTVSDVSFSLEEYKTFYMLYVNDFINENAVYLDKIGLDVNKDFSKQQYDEENTWEDVFIAQTEKEIKQFVALNKDAKKNDFKANVSTQVDEFIKILKNNAEYASIDFKEYLQNIFGVGVTEKDVKTAVEYKYKAIDYTNYLRKQIKDSMTEKDLIELYSDYPASFDKITYRIVEFDVDSIDLANSFKNSITSEDDFIDKALEFTDEDTLRTDVGTSSLADEELISWLYDDSRKKGDVELIKSDKIMVVYFKSREICEDRTVDFKHIYFSTNGLSRTEKDKIKAQASTIFEAFNETDKSEDTFSSYALVYSEDSTTAQSGGTFEGLRENSSDKAVNDWLFDSNRKYGDCELIEAEFGIHIIFYLKENDVFWKVVARDFLEQDIFNAYMNKLLSELE